VVLADGSELRPLSYQAHLGLAQLRVLGGDDPHPGDDPEPVAVDDAITNRP